MYKALLALFIFARFISAAKWAIDGSCDLVGTAKPANNLSPFLMATDELKEAMKEALTIAESALKVLQNHAEDQHVKNMLGLLLGDGAGYPAKLDLFKRTLEGVLTFEKKHAPHRPLDEGWKATMTSNDVASLHFPKILQQ